MWRMGHSDRKRTSSLSRQKGKLEGNRVKRTSSLSRQKGKIRGK
jgi:hypothetical protein